MTTWGEVEWDAPEFAARVRARFAIGTNKTIATLRSDGSPRISASEIEFAHGEMTLGMMGGSVKLRDVQRDPRLAVHGPTLEPPEDDPSAWPGDAKVAGAVVGIDRPAGDQHEGAAFFRIDLTEVVLTYVGTPADHLVIESWHPGRGWRRRTRTGAPPAPDASMGQGAPRAAPPDPVCCLPPALRAEAFGPYDCTMFLEAILGSAMKSPTVTSTMITKPTRAPMAAYRAIVLTTDQPQA